MNSPEEQQLYLGLSEPAIDAYSINLLDTLKVERLVRALNNKSRQKILTVIDQGKRLSVGNITEAVGLKQSLTSQNLAILRKAGLVIGENEGRHVLYRVNYRMLNLINRELASLWRN